METNEELKTPQNDWVEFAGDFLKAEHIKEWPVSLVVVDVKMEFDKDQNARLFMDTEYKNRKWRIEINKTNQKIIISNKVETPMALIGKKLTFGKIMVRNPSTNTQVPSFLLESVE